MPRLKHGRWAIPARLRELCERAGTTLFRIDREYGVHRKVAIGWFAGRRSVRRVGKLVLLSIALGVEVEELRAVIARAREERR